MRKIFETGGRFEKSNFFLFYRLKMFLYLPYSVFYIAVFDVHLFYLHKVEERRKLAAALILVIHIVGDGNKVNSLLL